MTLASALVWGFGGSVVLTILISGARAVGWTRMSLPWMLGAMFTPDRDRAVAIGTVVHLLNGCVFALLYSAAFLTAGGGSIALGAAIGLAHGLFVATAGLSALPAFHPRIARPHAGPTTERRLEPPGFLAMNYGWSTGAVLIVAHVAYGAVLGLGAALGR